MPNYSILFVSATAVVISMLSSRAYSATASACHFTEPSTRYEQNTKFVRVLNQFGNVLDISEHELDKLVGALAKRELGVSSFKEYYDPKTLRFYSNAYGDFYACNALGFSSLMLKPPEKIPVEYFFCFVTAKGTLDEGEKFVEETLFLPRSKWVNHLDFSARDSTYGKFLRTTRIGALIRRQVSGFYYLRHGDRYFNIRLSVNTENSKTTVAVQLRDTTQFVRQQIECEQGKVNF